MQRLGREVSGIAAAAALHLFNPESEIEVQLESGSLKAHAQVIGSIALLAYGAIAQYKDFRESLGLLVQDAQTFGSAVIEESLEVANAASRQVFRVERRTKTPGKILRLLRRREWLHAHRSQLAPDAIAYELKAIAAFESQVLADLQPEERRVFEKIIREDETPDVPAKRPEPEREAVEERHNQTGRFLVQDLFTDQPPQVHPLEPVDFYARFRLGDWTKQLPPSSPPLQPRRGRKRPSRRRP
jgi:hypothetical protein